MSGNWKRRGAENAETRGGRLEYGGIALVNFKSEISAILRDLRVSALAVAAQCE